MTSLRIICSIICLHFVNSISNRLSTDQDNPNSLDVANAIRFSQSNTCTETDNANHIQCFRELPLEKYAIFEGEDVLISCRVAYQQGKLQWAFKGKMLGYERDIPTHSRMRMPGNAAIGDHSLFIENVKVSDSGNYECQLAPAASQPSRRRMTNLIVLKAPSPPVIYQNGKPNKENISVSIRKGETDSFINLTCFSSLGNPSPTFEWSVNNIPLQPGSNFRSIKVSIDTINSDTSAFSIKSSQILNGDVIKCGVFNDATRKKPNLSDRVISTEVRVFKRTLPGKVLVTEMLDNEKAVSVSEQSQLKLSCVCSSPGDPPIDLNWYTSDDDKAVSNDWIVSIKNSMISQNVIKIPNINRTWHNRSVYCLGTQGNYPAALPVSVQIIVNHPPIKIDMQAISLMTNSSLLNPSAVYCKEGQRVRLSCTSDHYYTDNVSIVWYVKNTEDSEWQTKPSRNQKISVNPDGLLKQMTSTIDVSPSKIDKDISSHIFSRLLSQVVCIMRSPAFNIELRQQVKLELFERSSVPIITMNDQLKPPILTNGDSLRLRCSVTGGHPTPELHLLDENGLEIATPSTSQIGVTKLEYSIEVKPRDNGKKFRCVVYHKTVMDFMPLSSDIMVLKVANPPTQLIMKFPSSLDNLKAGQLISLQCVTDASFPEAKIEWWWHHTCKNVHMLGVRSLANDVRSNCQSEVLNEHQNTHYRSDTHSTISSINIKLTAEYDLSLIECLVVPHEKWTTFKGLLSKLTKLRVQYPPHFKDIKLLSYNFQTHTVEEGHNFSISIKSFAYPQINGFTWLLNKQPIERKAQVELSVDAFSVFNAQPDMMANYTLLVENQLGKASFDFFLNITFAPKLVGPTVETIKVNPIIEYKNKAVIMCSAQANPFREQSTVKWIRESPKILGHDDLLNIIQGRRLFSHSKSVHCAKDEWTEGNVSVNCVSLGDIEIVTSLNILSMDYRYIGSYKCIFSNSIKPSSAIKVTRLVYPTSPIAIKNYRKSEFVAKLGGKSELVCYFVGFPIPIVKWVISYKNGSTDNTMKYSTSTIDSQPGFVKATMAITDTSDMDLGRYLCLASNQYGESSHFVILERPRTPTQPMNFTVINVTDTSVSLGWITGFNGGSRQTLQLRWRLRDSDQINEFNLIEIKEDDDNDVQFYTITNLYRQREYEISIHAINRYTSNAGIPKPIIIKTINYEDIDSNLIQNDSKKGQSRNAENKLEKSDGNNLLVIVLLAIVGVLLVSLKIGMIVYFIRKRRMKQRKSREKLSSPVNHQMIDTMVCPGYLNNDDSMEMRAPSLVRSGLESNMYAQSISDHMSQNGSDNGLKLNYYKTNSDDQFQAPYLGPELDLVASVMGRNHFDMTALPSNFHPAYIQLAESASMTGSNEPYLAGYFTQRPYYNHATPARMPMRKSSHNSIDNTILPQYPISSGYQRRPDKIPYPQSAVSISTTSGDSNCSQSPPRKYIGYGPLVNQSGAPSTVEEYLSSGNSASDCQRFGINGSDEYFASPMTSFRRGQCEDQLNSKDYYSQMPSSGHPSQESTQQVPTHRILCDKDMLMSPYRNYSDHQRMSTGSENEHLLKPPLDFSGVEPFNSNDVQPQLPETHKLNYVDLISHSSPSVIRFTGPISENL